MESAEIMDFAREAVILTIKISAPAMLAGLAVGLIIALIQALTQIQEMTLVFVPKIMVIFVTLLITLPYMGEALQVFTEKIADKIVGMG
jgi:flagellar biosynthetic protein FliQ